MIAVQVAECVRRDKRRVRASLRETGWAAKVQSGAGGAHLRQTDWLSHTVLDAEIEWVELCVRRKDDVDAIETETRFVHDCRTERVRLVQRENLAPRLARVAEVRDRVSLQRGVTADT